MVREQGRATVDSVEIAWEARGEGMPTLLCLPGWCDSRAGFRNLAEALAARNRVVTLDWRGHGDSSRPAADFGTAELVADALAVIEAAGAESMVPISVSHAGWVALALRRRLGVRVRAAVLLDWIVLDPPPPFLAALDGLQDPERWRTVRDELFALWRGADEAGPVTRHLREVMALQEAGMWARAAREVQAAYAEEGQPLAALDRLDPPMPALHVYAQPGDQGYLAAQQDFAANHTWFEVRRITGATHFPALETPAAVAAAIEGFLDRIRVGGTAGARLS